MNFKSIFLRSLQKKKKNFSKQCFYRYIRKQILSHYPKPGAILFLFFHKVCYEIFTICVILEWCQFLSEVSLSAYSIFFLPWPGISLEHLLMGPALSCGAVSRRGCVRASIMQLCLTHTHTHNTHTTHTHTHHTHTHTHMLGFHVLWGLSIDVMVFILYKLYILSPYTAPIPKPNHHRRHSAILHFQKTHLVWFISWFPHGDQKMSPHGQGFWILPSLWGHFVPIT